MDSGGSYGTQKGRSAEQSRSECSSRVVLEHSISQLNERKDSKQAKAACLTWGLSRDDGGQGQGQAMRKWTWRLNAVRDKPRASPELRSSARQSSPRLRKLDSITRKSSP